MAYILQILTLLFTAHSATVFIIEIFFFSFSYTVHVFVDAVINIRWLFIYFLSFSLYKSYAILYTSYREYSYIRSRHISMSIWYTWYCLSFPFFWHYFSFSRPSFSWHHWYRFAWDILLIIWLLISQITWCFLSFIHTVLPFLLFTFYDEDCRCCLIFIISPDIHIPWYSCSQRCSHYIWRYMIYITQVLFFLSSFFFYVLFFSFFLFLSSLLYILNMIYIIEGWHILLFRLLSSSFWWECYYSLSSRHVFPYIIEGSLYIFSIHIHTYDIFDIIIYTPIIFFFFSFSFFNMRLSPYSFLFFVHYYSFLFLFAWDIFDILYFTRHILSFLFFPLLFFLLPSFSMRTYHICLY